MQTTPRVVQRTVFPVTVDVGPTCERLPELLPQFVVLTDKHFSSLTSSGTWQWDVSPGDGRRTAAERAMQPTGVEPYAFVMTRGPARPRAATTDPQPRTLQRNCQTGPYVTTDESKPARARNAADVRIAWPPTSGSKPRSAAGETSPRRRCFHRSLSHVRQSTYGCN